MKNNHTLLVIAALFVGVLAGCNEADRTTASNGYPAADYASYTDYQPSATNEDADWVREQQIADMHREMNSQQAAADAAFRAGEAEVIRERENIGLDAYSNPYQNH